MCKQTAPSETSETINNQIGQQTFPILLRNLSPFSYKYKVISHQLFLYKQRIEL